MTKPVTRMASLALFLPLLLSYSAGTAHAWNEETHATIARESVLFMLRSSNKHLRFAGSVIASAGEGSRASADGKRAWPLADEAMNVDSYRDVALRNTSTLAGVVEALPVLMYDVAGFVNFTAYNHFLLWGQNTTGDSIEEYPAFVRVDCDDCPRAGSSNMCQEMGGVCWRPGLGTIEMVQHDNEPGYALAADDSLDGTVDVGELEATAAEWIRRVGTRDFQRFCEEQIEKVAEDLRENGAQDLVGGIPLIGSTLKTVLNLPGISDLTSEFVGIGVDRLAAEAIAYLVPMCPYMVGTWEESPALARYRLNNSTIRAEHIDGIAMMDIRWHPADNLASYGAFKLRDGRRFDPMEQFYDKRGLIEKLCDDRPPRPGYDDEVNPPTAESDACTKALEAQWAAATEGAIAKYGDVRPFRLGHLPHLGRVIHAMSDLAVPGHVSGRLLHGEHLLVEENALAAHRQFDEYGLDDEQTSVTGAIQPAYGRSGDTVFELNGLIDTHRAETMILDIVADRGIEDTELSALAEDAARLTSRVAAEYRDDGDFDENAGLLRSSIRREFMTYAFVNNVVGITWSIQAFYSTHSSRSWDDMVDQVTWTDTDRYLRTRQPALSANMQAPRVQHPDRIVQNAFGETSFDADAKTQQFSSRKGYDQNVDAFYTEYQEITGCYVRSHSWRWSTGPEFVDSSELAVDVFLSPENVGGLDDALHVSGAYSAHRMDVEYYRGELSESAGQRVRAPAGALSAGIAIWCTGPDVWNTEHVTDNGNETAVVCEAAEIRPVGGLPCNRAEWTYWTRPIGEVKPGGNGIGVGIGTGSVRVSTVAGLAEAVGAQPDALARAVNPAGNQVATVVYPAPVGRASILFEDENHLQNEVVVGFDGRVTVRRTGAVPRQ